MRGLKVITSLIILCLNFALFRCVEIPNQYIQIQEKIQDGEDGENICLEKIQDGEDGENICLDYDGINYNGEDGEDICFDFDGENEVDDVIVAFPELIVEPAPEVAELVQTKQKMTLLNKQQAIKRGLQ